jgi:uncharacterized protein YbjQ (UPF0145 family)
VSSLDGRPVDIGIGARAIQALRSAGSPPPPPMRASAGELRSGSATASEALALEHAGYRPVAAVSGTAVCHIVSFIGYNGPTSVSNDLSTGMRLARSTAAARLAQAAARRGAAGVIDVRTSVEWRGAGTDHDVEISLTGTAVDGGGFASRRDPDAEPFMATLNGIEVARLAWSGWTPTGLAFGVAVRGFSRRRRRPFWTGGEAETLTEALYGARESAMRLLQADAVRQGADGVLGIAVTQNSHVWGRRAVEFAAVGTSVARTSAPEEIHPPEFGISLEDPRDEFVSDITR